MSKYTDKLYKVHEEDKYCCSQSVLMTFCEDHGIDLDTAAKIAAGFGAGISHLGCACGALCASVMVMGLNEANFDPKNQDDKHAFSDKVKAFGEKFKEEFGSLNCDDIRGGFGEDWLKGCWGVNQWCEKQLEEMYYKDEK